LTIKKYKIIHIHTDYKFVGTKRFECSYFDNTNIIIENDKPYKGIYKDSAIIFKNTKFNIDNIARLCEKGDLVVFHGLSYISINILLSLNNDVPVAWRLFGYELYSKMQNFCYTDSTLELLKIGTFKKIKNLLRTPCLIIHKIKTHMINKNDSLKKIIERINIFLCLCDEEYALLKQHFPYLPRYIKLPIIESNITYDGLFDKKKPLIVIGNSRSPYNNHIDIIKLISKAKRKEEYSFIMLFSYGGNGKYAQEVMKASEVIPHMTIQKDFIPHEEFISFYTKVSAFVLNSHREMAVGNIWESIKKGVKLYLNKKNPVFTWLCNEGFIIFTIEDFINDIDVYNVKLTIEQAQHNIQCLKNISKKYSVNDFQKIIFDYLSLSCHK